MISLKESDKVSEEIKLLVGTLKEFGISAAQLSNSSEHFGFKFRPSTLSRSMAPASQQKISLITRYRIADTTREFIRMEAKRNSRLVEYLKANNIDISKDHDYLLEHEKNRNIKINTTSAKEIREKHSRSDDIFERLKEVCFVRWEETIELEQKKAREILVITSDLEWIRNHINEILISLSNSKDKIFKIILTNNVGRSNEVFIKHKIKNFKRTADLEERIQIRYLYELKPYNANPFLGIPLLNDIVLYRIPERPELNGSSPLFTEGYYSITSTENTKEGFDSRIPKRKTEEIEVWFDTIWEELRGLNGKFQSVNPEVIT